MFGDAASGLLGFNELAHLNPLRWSGSVSFERGISDLEGVAQKGSRPIFVKVPSGVSTVAQEFATTQAAIDYLKRVDPVAIARRSKEKELAELALAEATEARDSAKLSAASSLKAVETEEEALAQVAVASEMASAAVQEAEAALANVKSELDCEWMFGDAGKGLLGLGVARLNPLRWSGGISFDSGISQLKEVLKETDRPIIVKVPSGITSQEQHFETVSGAIDYLQVACPLRKAAREALDAARAAVDAAVAGRSGAELRLVRARALAEAAAARLSQAEASLVKAKARASAAEA